MTLPVPEPESSFPSSVPSSAPLGRQLRNLLVVLSAIALSVLLFLGVQQQTQQPSLTSLAAASTPLETALRNGKPTVMEFYANWCTSCQAMVNDIAPLKRQYADQINFVMLNVDNNKWLPEVLRFRVDGIPHFVFLDATGTAIASSIGQQPQALLAQNLSALATHQPLPAQQAQGQISSFVTTVRGNDDDPRSHGSLPPT